MPYKRDYDLSLTEKILNIHEDSQIIDWENVFNNKNPIIVEIGCGNGHFIVGKAKESADRNFIGIDKKKERLIRCREKEEKNNLNNLHWICGDAFLVIEKMFNPETISFIYMIFPDPWPKRKHHKNRLFKKDFLDLIFEKLESNGNFLFVTDYKEYFNDSFSLVNEDSRFQIIKFENKEDFSISVFGEKWEKENRDFNIFLFKKKL